MITNQIDRPRRHRHRNMYLHNHGNQSMCVFSYLALVLNTHVTCVSHFIQELHSPYIPPSFSPDKHRVSDLIAAAEDHVRVLVSAIAEQSQLLDKEKLKLVAEQEILQEALQGNSSTTNVLDSEVAKVDKRLRADRVERDYLKEAENELKEKVKALKEEVSNCSLTLLYPPLYLPCFCSQNEDLDDQLEVDTESFEAKDEEMEDLLHQQADIKEEKEALLSLIQETKKKLESKQYLARVAKRQERVAKASHTATTKTKYANVRYTMTK